MAENLLYLCPKDFHSAPQTLPELIEALQHAGFIGDTIEVNGATHYQPGDEFLTLITFLGCSPVISLGEPGKTGDEFCHIALEGPYDKPHFAAGDNLKIPRCPGCGHRFETWQPLIEQWQDHPEETRFDCPECSRTLSAPELRWRKCAGFGRFFIKVWGIFESEAVPNPNLMSVLKKRTGCDWLHFYVRHL
jgi:hypothetical protein